MSWPNLLQYAVFLLIVALLVKPTGTYLALVFEGEKTLLDPLLRPVERLLFRLFGIDATEQMDWKRYALCFTLFGLLGTLLLYSLLRFQSVLAGSSSAYLTTPLTPDLAANTAISFATTTTWQAYGGESTMTYLSQMVGLCAQNFLAGAAGLALGIAFIRGLVRQQTEMLGNFWVDIVRATLWVLLPLSLLGGIVLVWQGVPLNFDAYTPITTLEGRQQIIAQGPVAALEFIKNLGTNGGGFFNVNAAHPYENPTPLTNFLEMLAIVVLPAAFTHTFGRLIGRPKEGWVLFGVMTALFLAGLLACGWVEQTDNPRIAALVSSVSSPPSGNLEGKEIRFGIGGSVLGAIATSNGATGSYNSMHDSYLPLGGAVPLVNMLLGEIIYGGLGTGLYSIIIVQVVALFLAGLMVGSVPEYLGKRIGVAEVKLVALYTLLGPMVVLILTALAVVTAGGKAGLTTNDGFHGLTEILYAYISSFANNGQNFAGLSANSTFYNLTTSFAMIIGRYGQGVVALALAAQFAKQVRRPFTSGSLPTATVQFAGFLIATIFIVGGLSYFPVLALGPFAEHIRLSR
ncbi:MAG: potassium-transporting ATPase subunit KdpA [Anaerolineae bacterium]|nr:potassium-transporting ATPase subunit KdpA [Gloeobacterales cyanobacterium ES-bin-313]